MTWDINDDGLPELTDFGKSALLSSDGAEVPEEYGSGSYSDGLSTLNVDTIIPIDIDPDTNSPYYFTLWDTYQKEYNTNPVITDWSSHMDNAETTIDYLEKNDQLLVAPGASYLAPEDDSEIETLRNQVKSTVVEYSWKMVFAKDEAEFNSLLKEMQDTAKGLNYDKVLAIDMQNAKDQQKAREEVVKEAKADDNN